MLDEPLLCRSVTAAMLCLLYERNRKEHSEEEDFFCQHKSNSELFQTLNSGAMLPVQDHEKYFSVFIKLDHRNFAILTSVPCYWEIILNPLSFAHALV